MNEEQKKPNPNLPVRQLIRFSNYSLCITLPKEYIDCLSWKQGDRIAFQLNRDKQFVMMSKEEKTTSVPSALQPEIIPPTKPDPLEAPKSQEPHDKNPDVPPPISHDDLEPIPQIN